LGSATEAPYFQECRCPDSLTDFEAGAASIDTDVGIPRIEDVMTYPSIDFRRASVFLALFIISGCSAEVEPPDANSGNADTVSSEDMTTSDVIQLEALSWELDASGPFQVGYRTLEFTYDADGDEEERTIKLSIWYPTEDASGEPGSYLGLLDDPLVFTNAALAPSVYGESYPVHVHSHGHQGFAGSSNFLMRHFASHGWVVAAPDHRGNTLIDNIEPRPSWMYTVRPSDITASLDTLANLPVDDPLASKLATERVLMSGHSYGGYTTFVSSGASFDPAKIEELCPDDTCSKDTLASFNTGVRDERVIAAIPMAAGNRDMFGEAGYQDLACPVLYMTGSVDHPGVNEAVWEGLQGTDSVRIDIEGGCHQLFGLGACHEISDDQGFAIVDAYALAFGRYHVLGDSGVRDIIDGSSSLSVKVLFMKQESQD
jgi:predicted dienelactone hydrolase